MPELLDVDEARGAVLKAVRALPAEDVALAEGLGRVLAEDVESPGEVPPFDSSAMDGYAVEAGPPAELRVVAESRAGHPADRPLRAGEAIAISTGAQVPTAARVAVAPVERVERSGEGLVRVPATEAGENVRRAGEDVRSGTVVLRRGTALRPAELAVAASVGRSHLSCGGRPRVGVAVTGDELVAPGRPLGPGQIRDSNAIALAAQSVEAGGTVEPPELVPDDREATIAALARLIERCDVVCVSGGVSVGPHDHVKPAFAELGVAERFWGVRLKPGKPTWFGTRGRTLVFGLPGNPVSAMVTFHLFVRPALRLFQGGDPAGGRTEARLTAPLERNARRDQAVRCRLAAGERGVEVEPTGAQGSHILTSMTAADALALVPAGDGELSAGDRVEIELLDPC